MKVFRLIGVWMLTFCAKAGPDHWGMNMHKGVTPISHDMYGLHMIALWVCVAIGVIVFGVMIYSILHHRKSKGHQAANFHDNDKLEILWTIVPFLILIGLAIPATEVLIRQKDTAHSDVTIKIVGYQWKWEYEYLDQGIRFFSNLSTPYNQIQNKQPKSPWYLLEVDHPMVLPVNKKIRFLVTSNDVVHSWWVPDLGIKRDAIPGFMHEAWARIDKIGTYRGQCAELCGINHGFMPIVVKVVSEQEFEQWVNEQKKLFSIQSPPPNPQLPKMTHDSLMKLGKEQYDLLCSACHQTNGKGIPPLYPALKNSSVAVGHPIDRHIDVMMNGISGSAMQGYKDQLSNEVIAAIVTYERNAWGNNTNEDVQPEEVQKLRELKKAQPGGLR
jgi:cytochrome c oxidase subunit 2